MLVFPVPFPILLLLTFAAAPLDGSLPCLEPALEDPLPIPEVGYLIVEVFFVSSNLVVAPRYVAAPPTFFKF